MGPERIEFSDPVTRVHIVQLTSNVTMSMNLYFEETPFTPDSRTPIFKSRRGVLRNDPWDLYRVDADGSEFVQLTDCDDFRRACLSLDGTCAYYSTSHEIRSVRLDDQREETLLHRDDAKSFQNVSAGGKYVFTQGEFGDHVEAIRIDIKTGAAETVVDRPRINHLSASRTGNWISWVGLNETRDRRGTWRVAHGDGSDVREWPEPYWSHSAWVGEFDRMQGALLVPGRGLSWLSPEQDEHDVIAEGAYFVHSAGSIDGEWIVSDTNWPNIGLQLVHVPSGRWDTLCLDQSSYGHPQYTHPHPVFSPDASRVLYQSDRTGIPQVYVVTVPDWLQEELRTGSITNRSRVASRNGIGVA